MPFTATTKSGITIYRINEYHNMNDTTKDLMAYLNTNLVNKTLTGLDVEYHANVNIFYIHNMKNPGYSFTVHCTKDEGTYILAPRNISPDTYRYKLTDVIRYVEDFFHTEPSNK